MKLTLVKAMPIIIALCQNIVGAATLKDAANETNNQTQLLAQLEPNRTQLLAQLEPNRTQLMAQLEPNRTQLLAQLETN